jgi:hypothetical protein
LVAVSYPREKETRSEENYPAFGITPSAEPTQSIHLGFLAIDYLGFVLEFYGLFHVAKIRLVATLRYCSIKEAALAQDLRLRNRYLDPWLGLGPEKWIFDPPELYRYTTRVLEQYLFSVPGV